MLKPFSYQHVPAARFRAATKRDDNSFTFRNLKTRKANTHTCHVFQSRELRGIDIEENKQAQRTCRTRFACCRWIILVKRARPPPPASPPSPRSLPGFLESAAFVFRRCLRILETMLLVEVEFLPSLAEEKQAKKMLWPVLNVLLFYLLLFSVLYTGHTEQF